MKAQSNGSYRNSKGNLVFRYIVKGTKEQIEAYKKAQGEFYRENDNKEPLWFSSRFAGKNPSLIITQKGRVIADMSEFDAAGSLAQQYGGNLGSELARTAAALLLGSGSTSQSTVADTQVIPEADADLDRA